MHIDRGKVLFQIIRSLDDLYMFTDPTHEFSGKLQLLEGVIVRIAVQTAEFGIFILQYTSDAGRLPHSSIDGGAFDVLLYAVD